MDLYKNEDIDGVMRYMSIFHPENADKVYCHALLEYWEMTLKDLAINNPEDLEKIIQAFEGSKSNG